MILLLACYQPELGVVRGDDPLWDRHAMGIFEVELDAEDWRAALLDGIDPEDDCSDRAYQIGRAHV